MFKGTTLYYYCCVCDMYVCMRMLCACCGVCVVVGRRLGESLLILCTLRVFTQIVRFGRPALSPEEQSILPHICGFNENPCYFSLLIMAIFGFREALESHSYFRKRLLSYFCVGSAYAETDV